MAVLRLTWGNDTPPYSRKAARISARKIRAITGIDDRAVRRDLEILRKRKILARRREKNFYLWGIRKDFDKWRGEMRTSAPEGARAQGAEVRNNADSEVRNNADSRALPKIEEQRIRRANSRPQSQSQLTHLGETIRSLRL
jgi:hypothetical protein